MATIKELIKLRAPIKARLTRFGSYLEDFETRQLSDIHAIRSRLVKIQEAWKDFDGIQNQIESLTNNQELELREQKAREEFEELYFELTAKADRFIEANMRPVSQDVVCNPSASIINNLNSIKLPAINLPTFSGAYDEWLHYHDSFKSIIDSNDGLSAIQKFHYLRSSLVGEALEVIKSLSISANNYSVAWNLLIDEYQSTRAIIMKHINSLLELPIVKTKSHQDLKSLLNNARGKIRALEALEQPVSSWDVIIVGLLTSKLDSNSRHSWAAVLSNKKPNELPTIAEFFEFLVNRCQYLEDVEIANDNLQKQRPNSQAKSRPPPGRISSYVGTASKCQLCKAAEHAIYACPQFIEAPVAQRNQHAKMLKLCFNCLGSNHQLRDCKKGPCRKCQKRHNTMLHIESSHATDNSIATVSNHAEQSPSTAVNVLLSTAMVCIKDRNGQPKQFRALLDSGSQMNFITEQARKTLGHRIIKGNYPVIGIGGTTIITKRIETTILSQHNSYKAKLQFSVIPKITENLPLKNTLKLSLRIPSNIQLADPNFLTSSPIDLLIGAEIYGELLCVGQIQERRDSPIFQKTQLGWIALGRLPITETNTTICNLSTHTLEEKVSQFWEIEEMPHKQGYNEQEWRCEEHFTHHVRRNEDGRFTVALPFHDNKEQLGDSIAAALKRFESLERRFSKDENLRVEYSSFMAEYENLGHMRLAQVDLSEPHFYLPHHAVIKAQSTTTKLRVVFDGSAQTTSGVSLNDTLLKGPTVQDNLICLMLRMRIFNVVITGDIEKMYRQIQIAEEDKNYQLILWRSDTNSPIRTYRLQTVTYGTTPAAFLATRCLQQLARDEKDTYPEASRILERDFYVDDLVTGTDTVEEAVHLRQELIALLRSGGFNLRKIRSNIPEVAENGQEDLCAPVVKGSQVEEKTLGMIWNSYSDVFQYCIKQKFECRAITKRSILATSAQIYDPMGLLGPAIIIPKLIMQRLWQYKIHWDEAVPQDVYIKWKNYTTELQFLNDLRIPRQVIGFQQPTRIELHGFCDASQVAYGACVYLRATDSHGNSVTRLLCAKSRVAPLKVISLPRLELCGALLLSQLSRLAQQVTSLSFDSQYLWTDSTIVLAWLKAPANRYKTFVANRIAEIQENSRNCTWSHVSTNDNPADIISRGLMPRELVNANLWWHGPEWLQFSQGKWPNKSVDGLSEDEGSLEIRPVALISHQKTENWLLHKFSKFVTLKRVIAWCLKFSKRARGESTAAFLSVAELRDATHRIVKLVQQEAFTAEISSLSKSKPLDTRSKLLTLNPFLDEEGLLRVGGRLRAANISYARKHPLVLPSNHYITKLIIEYYHRKYFHAGTQAVLCAVRERYWPLTAKSTIRSVLGKCITCFRAKPNKTQHLMGDLPAHRVQKLHTPFEVCGVDYAGPTSIKEAHRRGRIRIIKCYVAVFVCFATKAIHLELVSSLTTEAFLAALRRFIARRGCVRHIYSDNATNFVGARNELKELYKLASRLDIQGELAENCLDPIVWHFIPPRSPHFGGLWEAGVKAMKFHIKRSIGDTVLTFEEYNTLLTQIEACLNSRPLTPLSNDPNDLSALTPAHFLHGIPNDTLTEPDLSDLASNRLSRWQHIQKMKRDFWKRWSKDYLYTLQQRTKWKSEGPSVKEGCLVLLIDENVPPQRWSIGRVVELHPGKDKTVRVVSVKTSKGIVKRATKKVCMIPMEN